MIGYAISIPIGNERNNGHDERNGQRWRIIFSNYCLVIRSLHDSLEVRIGRCSLQSYRLGNLENRQSDFLLRPSCNIFLI